MTLRANIPTVAVVSAALVTGAFWGAWSLQFAPIDDAFLIVENIAVIGPSWEALRLAWTTYDPELFIPLTIMSYHADFLVHGLSPSLMHFEHLALHLFNTVLTYLLLRRWTGRGAGALLLAALFAVHPVQTEAVVWLSARKDLLMTLFSLASLLTFETFLTKRQRRWVVMSGVLFAAAMLSKPSAVLLPMVMAYRMTAVMEGGWRRLFILWPHALVAGATVAIGIAGKSHLLGLQNPLLSLGIALQGMVLTLGKYALLVPLRVSYDLAHPSVMTMVFCGLLMGGVVAMAMHQRTRTPLVTLGTLWFVALLLPSLLNTRVGGIATLAADRYAYLPMIGVLAALAGVGEWMLRSDRARRIVAGATCVFIVVCIPLTRLQTSVWASPVALFEDSLRKQPTAVSTRIALVRTLQGQGKTEEAFALLKEGLTYGDDARLHLAAGYLYAQNGEPESAKEQFLTADRMEKASPDADYALGALLRQLGDNTGAEAALRQAILEDRSFVEARVELAKILVEKGKTAEAAQQLRTALEWNPSNVEAQGMLEKLDEEEGR